MAGPRFSLERARQRRLLHECRAILRIDFFHCWPKQKIDPGRATECFIGLLRPRIFLVIASRLELQRVNENAHCHVAVDAGVLARDADQFAMRLVQRAHRRHEHAPFHPRLCLRLSDCRHDLHLE